MVIDRDLPLKLVKQYDSPPNLPERSPRLLEDFFGLMLLQGAEERRSRDPRLDLGLARATHQQQPLGAVCSLQLANRCYRILKIF